MTVSEAPTMPSVSRDVATPATTVWSVLSDGWTYAMWVIGTSRIRAVDATWPEQGARIHHSVGIWPALLSDFTSVEDLVPNHQIVLTARGWPLGEARIEITVEPTGPRSCTVTMSEDFAAGPGRFIPRAARDLLIKPRNVESLRRLALLAEGRGSQGVTEH
jgi:uncharacterized protein YndB with AHSA1/START domain